MTMRARIQEIRETLEPHFSQDTSISPGDYFSGRSSSAGHCGAVAVILYHMFPMSELMTIHGPDGHWFNKINGKYVDITGDQFGWPPIQIVSNKHSAYPNATSRSLRDVPDDIYRNARTLAIRAGMENLIPETRA